MSQQHSPVQTEPSRSQAQLTSTQLKIDSATQVLDTRTTQSAQRRLQSAANASQSATQLKRLQATIAKRSDPMQRMEDEEPLQAQSETAQLLENGNEKPNNTGLPNQLKAGIESMSGISMDHVKVHYNSDKPAQLNAHAYAQGSDIHVAPGQEQHLPHEAWHVVQQAQGRVKPTMQMKTGVPVNDDAGLETEADVMGAKASQLVEQVDGGLGASLCNGSGSAGASHSFARPLMQFATKIHHYTQQIRQSALSAPLSVGAKADSYLDVDDPKNGSQPGGSGTHDNLMAALTNRYSGAGFLRGHLLNDNLGGLGVWENMFPITKNANVHHLEGAERWVKQSVLEAKENDDVFAEDSEVEDALEQAGDDEFLSPTYFYSNGYGGRGDRNDEAIPQEWHPHHVVHYEVQMAPDYPNNFLAQPASTILCQWETTNSSEKKVEELSPQGDFLSGQEQIPSEPGVASGQNAALEEYGWGSMGSGASSGADVVTRGAEGDIPGLPNTFQGAPLSRYGEIQAYVVTQEP